MVTTQIHKAYTEAVENAYPKAKDMIIGNLSVDEYIHVIQIATDILLSRDKLQVGGHFVESINNNKLYESFARADEVCERAIKFFIFCRESIIVKLNN
jgi:hypothetical protein